MVWTRQRITLTVAVAIVLTNLVVGALLVRGSGGAVRQTAATPAPSPQLRSPFTGKPVSSLNRVLAVKIDNTALGRPWTGLAWADIVYVLPVEGGLSRLLAVFSSRYPLAVCPVRSAREEDLSLLRQVGDHRQRRAPVARYRGDPAHDGPHLAVPGAGRPRTPRAEHRIRQRGDPPERQGLDRPLVTAPRGRRHDLHYGVRPVGHLRPRPGLDRAHPPLAHRTPGRRSAGGGAGEGGAGQTGERLGPAAYS